MDNQNFGGDKKMPMKSLFASAERKFINTNVAKFPAWIQGNHLTMLTLPFSAALIVFGYLAKDNYNWLWLSSVMLFLQWFTDSFDGALGRFRNTGIPLWGFYMDHLLDFVFMSCVFFSYSFLFAGLNRILVYFSVPAFGCLMVSSFLAFGATGEFKITYLRTGPTEVRATFILLNCAIIMFGTGFLEKSLLYIFIIFITSLCIVIFRTQKYIWNLDMANKDKRNL